MNPAQLLNPKAFAKASSSKSSPKSNGNSHSMSPSFDLRTAAETSLEQQDLSTLFPSASGNMNFNTSDQDDMVPSQQEHMGVLPSTPPSNAALVERSPHSSDNDSTHDANEAYDQPLTELGTSHSKKTTKNEPAPVSVPSYNPADLLNPKAAAKRAREAPSSNDVHTNGLANGPANDVKTKVEEGEVGMGSMIEGLHKVQKRESQAIKRQKVEDDEDSKDKPRAQFNGGGKGGVISEHMKKKREEAEAEAGPSSIVDLTADNEDDVVFVKSTGPDPMREVCLGHIEAKISAHQTPSATNKALDGMRTHWPISKVFLRRPPGQNLVLEVIDRLNNHFGNLDVKTATALLPLMNGSHQNKLRWSVWLDPRNRKEDDRPGKPISEMLPCKVILFSPAQHSEGIGKILSKQQVWLRDTSMTENRELLNPQVPKIYSAKPGVMTQMYRQLGQQQQMTYSTRTVEEIKTDVQGMFDKLTNVEDLPEMEGNKSLITTELMEHQKQALWFLTKQETPVPDGEDVESPLWKSRYHKDGSKIWYNVIAGNEVKKPDVALGGIFADMMGLGKTLSLLSRICATIEEAKAFGRGDLPRDLAGHATVERNTKGTLIVCPKSVLSNWDEQIKAHLDNSKVSFYSYHGPKREQNVDVLAKYDIVITSYTTVATEFSYSNSKYKALGKLNWYRIVLDEAHMIRNQTTSTFVATCALSSTRRWAVTGTPVQNKLDDLGALIKFVKISPFHEKGSFEKHFLAPFKMQDTQVLDNLRLLVDSITLRRSKDKIDLPNKVENVHRLNFSSEERALYDAFAKDSNRKVNAMISANGLRGKGYAHMLTAITRLRLICAHGRELMSDEDMRMLEGMSYGTAISLSDEHEDKPVLTEGQVYQMFFLLRDSTMNVCSRCAVEVGREDDDEDDESEDGEVDGALGYMTPCYHILCPKCKPGFDSGLAVGSDKYATCPICQMYIRMSFPPITRDGIDAATERRNELRAQPHKAKTGQYSGPHTKVKALLGKLKEHRAESEILYNESPIRSVVFTGWTQYLDLIEIALKDADIGFLRLDGKMSVSARTRVLEQFRTDNTISVILVSIKAGGQGLNFTAANKVFMMEPQFNPGVEMQAIDRVHRLGQTRDVEITKFIMADSFEEAIVELQRKKMQLANTAFKDGKRMTKMEEAKKRMEDLKSLFK